MASDIRPSGPGMPTEGSHGTQTRGFTMLEIVLVVSIAAILTSVALRGFSGVASRMAADDARRSFAAMQARARASALETGSVSRLRVDPAGDSAWVTGSSGTVERLNFATSREVDVQSTESGIITLCINPRGFGDIRCNSFDASTVDLTFVQGGQSAALRILPLGTLRW